MFGAFERMVAFRYLRARRREGFISVITWFSFIGIMLGVGALIVVMAVMNGLRSDMLGRIIGVSGHVLVQGGGQPLTGFDDLARRIAAIPGVTRVVPMVEAHVMASSGAGGAVAAILRGLRPERLAEKDIVGATALAAEPEAVILGWRLAERLRLGVGDRVTFLVPEADGPVPGIAPRMRSYPVIELFHTGLHELDGNLAFTSLAAAQTFARLGDGVSQLEVMVADPERVTEIRRDIERVAGGAKVIDWQQANATLFNALQVERNVTFILLTLVILVAAFNIISSLSMLVKEKGRDVAILRTIGASRGMILRIFLLSGTSVGVAGTLTGLALGLAFALNVATVRRLLQPVGGGMFAGEISFLANLPARVEAGEVVAVVAMAIGLSFVATIYPSWRAARLDPVEALRYE